MSDQLRWLAARQDDVVATWQLRRAGWSWDKVRHHLCKQRRLFAGVYLLTSSPPTRRQRWIGAVLTAPGTVLSHGSAGACFGFYSFDAQYEVVTRPGSAGRRRQNHLLIFRSTVLDGNVTRHTGIPITTAARTLIDLAPALTDTCLGRAFRESIRLETTTTRQIVEAVHGHRGRPGIPRLLALATRYSDIPYDRTRSNPEARALEVLHDAAIRPALVNVDIAGAEADLVWPDQRLIIEIDGPQFHLFRAEDERKEAIWRDAGYIVRRIPSHRIYDAPHELLGLYDR